MLVLTRHSGEKLVIAGDIEVTVVAIEGNKVRLGIKAPKSVRVDREEIHSRRLADKAAASTLTNKLEPAASVLVGMPHP